MKGIISILVSTSAPDVEEASGDVKEVNQECPHHLLAINPNVLIEAAWNDGHDGDGISDNKDDPIRS
jgi:hypothetical protein